MVQLYVTPQFLICSAVNIAVISCIIGFAIGAVIFSDKRKNKEK